MDSYLVIIIGTKPIALCITSVTCSKLIETIISFIFIFYTCFEIFKTIKLKFKLTFILSLQIILGLSLLFNILHSIWDKQVELILEILFANIFFLTLFYYVGYNVLIITWTRILLHALYAFFVLLQIAVALTKIIDKPKICQETWYLVISSIAIFISFLLFILYWKKQQSQKKFLSQTTGIHGFHNPFKIMWIMILGNIFCSLMNLSYSITLIVCCSQTCKLTENNEAIIDFAFIIFTYYVGVLCTLLVMRYIRIKKYQNIKILRSSSNFSNIESGRGKLELILRKSSRSHSSSLT